MELTGCEWTAQRRLSLDIGDRSPPGFFWDLGGECHLKLDGRGGGGGVLVSHWVGFCAKSGSGDIKVWSRNYKS